MKRRTLFRSLLGLVAGIPLAHVLKPEQKPHELVGEPFVAGEFWSDGSEEEVVLRRVLRDHNYRPALKGEALTWDSDSRAFS